MKTKLNLQTKIMGILLISIFLLQACTSNNPPEISAENEDSTGTQQETSEDYEDEIDTSSDEILAVTSEETVEINQNINPASNELSEEEVASLVFMREEEKLARDVYLGLYDLWSLSIFQNITDSEQTHTDAVKKLLDQFVIEDPADTSSPGIFVNEELQKLYIDIMAIGAQSLGDALKVGAAIEEIDILDLQKALEFAENEAIQQVYENLLKGSENHLRAFTSTLERQTGEIYQPQYMTQADYDAIVSSSNTRGGQGKRNRS